MTPAERGTQRRRARVGSLLLLLCAAVTVIPTSSPARAAETGLITLRTWKPTVVPTDATTYASGVQLFPEAATRRLYAVGMGDGFVGAYNLDTLAALAPGLQLVGTPTAVLADGITGGAFVALRSSTGQPSLHFILAQGGQLRDVASVDLSSRLPGQEVVGLYRPPGSHLLWMVSNTYGAGGLRLGGGVTLAEYDIAVPEQPAVFSWTQQLPSCLAPSRSGPGTPASIGYANGAAYFGCANPGPVSTPGPPLPRGAALLTIIGSPASGRTTPGTFLIYPRDGDFSSGQSYWDPGSKRLTMAALSAGAATTYVFDATTNSYVGNISTGKNFVKQAGINILTGRYYAATGSTLFGLVAADVRATPASQGANYPAFANDANKNPVDDAPMAIDAVGRRIFLRYNLATEGGGSEFHIVEDRLPVYLPPPKADPDVNTTDAPEAPGKTDSTYASAAQGYGSRFRQIGGEQTLEGNITMFGADFLNNSPVGRGTRELRGAYLTHLAVLNTEAGASAISVDRDRGNTQSDLDRAHAPHPDQLPPDFSIPGGVDPFQPPVGWPIKDAYCADFGGEEAANTSTNAQVSCDSSKHVATASALFTGATIDQLGVSSSNFQSKVNVTGAMGSVSTITSTAKGISVLGGRLQVRSVVSEASATAHGRKGTAKATWRREVQGVTIDGTPVCDQQCDTRAIIDAVNSAFAGKVVVQFPLPELSQSPGGYEALVRRPEAQQLEEVLLNGEAQDRLFVPGMVIMVAEDGPKAARTRVDLAGVEAEAHYGISVLESFGAGADGSDLDSLVAAGGLGDAVGSPLFGLTPGAGGATPESVSNSSSPSGAGGLVGDAGRLIWNGLHGLGALLPIWAVLLAPIYLSARRWLLLQRAQLVIGGKK
jgi:hypothetical protein